MQRKSPETWSWMLLTDGRWTPSPWYPSLLREFLRPVQRNILCCVYKCYVLLLHSQLYLLGLPFWVRFLRMWLFFNPTIEVVTFSLRGWCMLGVLLTAFTHLGCLFRLICQNPSWMWISGSFESMRWNACVLRLDLSLYCHLKEFWGNGVGTHVHSKGKIPPTGSLEEDQTHDATSRRSVSQTHYWLSYSSTPMAVLSTWTVHVFIWKKTLYSRSQNNGSQICMAVWSNSGVTHQNSYQSILHWLCPNSWNVCSMHSDFVYLYSATSVNPLMGATWPFVYFLQGRLGRAATFTWAYWFVCPATVAKHLLCEQPVKEVQLTSICYVQLCVYSSSYSYGESIVDWPRSSSPLVPIAISSSQSSLLSVIPVWCMDTANFINVKVRVCYSFSKHNILSAKAKEWFVVCLIHWRDPSWKPATCFFNSTFKNSLTFASYTKTMQNGVGEVAEVSYCYYSRDSHEIVWKFLCMEVVKLTDRNWAFWDVLPAAPLRRFRMLRPMKG